MTTTIPIPRAASELVVGDRIAPKFLPTLEPAEVVFVLSYTAYDESWTFVAYQFADAEVDSDRFLADAKIPLEAVADPSGMDYTRADTDADDPTPVSPARVPLHTGGAVSGIAEDGRRDGEPSLPVDETPAAQHYEKGGWKGAGPGSCGVECACGVSYDGFDTLAEAGNLLGRHIEAATSPTGLTNAADQSRGALAGTTPVVTYFSFGHGQSDPTSGESLLNHYATVVATTYEQCREAMFASRFGRAWSFDYLAGTAKATEWIPRWTEHEVIVAPGTDPVLADLALKAARDVLAGETEPKSTPHRARSI